jgi:hypothetical protein
MVNALANWLHATSLGAAAAGGSPWLEPACKILHFIGLALLFGCVAVFDLRALGFARSLPVGPLQRLMPFAALGFVINLATGIVLFAGNPDQYTSNKAFGLKMLFVVLAGLNGLVFYAIGLHRAVEHIGPDQDVPVAVKLAAATSLLLWLGVIFWGRMLPFIGNAF